jgi:hypothetical protein
MKRSLQIKGTAAQAKFWIRVFALEEEIEKVQARLSGPNPPGGADCATVPVFSEYTVDSGLKFYYALVFRVDQLGADHVLGMLYFGDEPEWPRLSTDRDNFAEEVLANMPSTRYTEVSPIPIRKEQ